MTKVISYIWQLRQNLLGLIVIFCSNAKRDEDEYWTTNYRFGVSLGWYIIVNKNCTMNTIKHERGHQKQSLYLGPLYLIAIGLFSAIGNILHRFIKFNYYKQPWEAWADKLGGVNRLN